MGANALRRTSLKRHSPWSLRVRVAVTTVALSWGLACAVSWAMPSRVSVKQSSDVALVDDDGSTPLFELPELKPDATIMRCMALRYTGEGPADVRMVADGGSGPIAERQVSVRIDVGSGGRFGDCTGFTGTTVFAGTLAELTQRGTGWMTALPISKPTQSAAATVRITASIDDSATQGAGSRVALVFTARSLVERVDAEPTTLTPAPAKGKDGTTPKLPDLSSVDGTGAGAPAPSAPKTTDSLQPLLRPNLDSADIAGETQGGTDPAAPATSTGTGTGPGVVGDGAGARTPEGASGDTVLPPRSTRDRPLGRKLAEGIGRIGKQLSEAAETVLVRSPFPLVLGLMVFGFLGLQNRIDRRDPKLAMAPVFRDPDVQFREPDPSFDEPLHRSPFKSEAGKTDPLV